MDKKDIIALIEKAESILWEAYQIAEENLEVDNKDLIMLKHQWNIVFSLKTAIIDSKLSMIETKLDTANFIKAMIITRK